MGLFISKINSYETITENLEKLEAYISSEKTDRFSEQCPEKTDTVVETQNVTPKKSKPGSEISLFEQGLVAVRLQQYKLAIKHFDAAFKSDPFHEHAYSYAENIRGYLLIGKKKYRKAKCHFMRAYTHATLDSDRETTYQNWQNAHALYLQKRRDLRKKQRRKKAHQFYLKGLAHKEQGDLQLAIDCYRETLKFNPFYPEIRSQINALKAEIAAKYLRKSESMCYFLKAYQCSAIESMRAEYLQQYQALSRNTEYLKSYRKAGSMIAKPHRFFDNMPDKHDEHDEQKQCLTKQFDTIGK